MIPLNTVEWYSRGCLAYTNRFADISQSIERLINIHNEVPLSLDTDGRNKYLALYRAQDSFLEAAFADILPEESLPRPLVRLLESFAALAKLYQSLNSRYISDIENIFCIIDECEAINSRQQTDLLKAQLQDSRAQLAEAMASNQTLIVELEQLMRQRDEAEVQHVTNASTNTILDTYKNLCNELINESTEFFGAASISTHGQGNAHILQLIESCKKKMNALFPTVNSSSDELKGLNRLIVELIRLLLKVILKEKNRNTQNEIGVHNIAGKDSIDTSRLDILEKLQSTLRAQVDSQSLRLEKLCTENVIFPIAVIEELAIDASMLKKKSEEQIRHMTRTLDVKYELVAPADQRLTPMSTAVGNSIVFLEKLIDIIVFLATCICNISELFCYGDDVHLDTAVIDFQRPEKKKTPRKRNKSAKAKDMISSTLETVATQELLKDSKHIPQGDMTPSGQRTYTARARLMQL